ncbi:MAG: COX15/CtaA family protein [Deltaproteobacteria bacterium]|nr:COX15/CtaA family protein [Deltaproteobacteria bacterium]
MTHTPHPADAPHRPTSPRRGEAGLAWGVLALNIAVILWGAYVRATGSGAGCGEHWPTCNGQVIPRDPSVKTLIEFTHRITSGVAFLAVVALFAWVRRRVPRGHPARAAAAGTLFFMITEAAVGALLVLFRLVADNESMARAMFMAVHLVNTFLLLACLALTAWWLAGAPPPSRRSRPANALILAVLGGVMLLGVSGAVAALGDTLYPARSLQEGIAMDLSPTASLLVRLRILHPGLAAVIAIATVAAAWMLPRRPLARRVGVVVTGVTCLQVAGGILNVLLLAPVWMQLIHLLVADAVWIGLVLLGAALWAEEPA